MRTISNPPNPFESHHRELLEPAPSVQLKLIEDTSRSILSRNDSPDLPFRWSVNPYRGCFHACAYCYARPTHEYLGFGAGTDFESTIIVKPNAASLLQKSFLKPSWKGDLVVFSGNTDCYQPIEATYGLTRACLKVCADYQNPVGVITKAALILRDLDLLHTLHQSAWVKVYFSIAFAHDDMARKVEPQAPSISKRLEVMAKLSQAGIPTAVSLAPIIPGLNEQDIPTILSRAREAGAQDATYAVLRLPGSTSSVFLDRIGELFPDRLDKIIHRLQEIRGGHIQESRFFKRQTGQGNYWHMIEQLFQQARQRAGFPASTRTDVPNTFFRPLDQQLPLFQAEELLYET